MLHTHRYSNYCENLRVGIAQKGGMIEFSDLGGVLMHVLLGRHLHSRIDDGVLGFNRN